ncbi:hypothetical protein OYC64_012193 [Pagothenia borchgrevinki]|uniref:Uncharacterized protein n=1 Tax=Pagothenia borchgrevinki TaxID=8213 RepID=A0ABD2G7K5_PAGBO
MKTSALRNLSPIKARDPQNNSARDWRPDGIVISSVLGSVAAEGAEGNTGGEASDDRSITVVQIGQNGEYLGTARPPAQTEGTCYKEPITGEAAGPRV